MVFDKVKEIIIDQLDVDASAITPDTSLTKDLEADSLDAVEIIMAIEDEYEIEIPDEEAEKFANIGDIVNFIEDQHRRQIDSRVGESGQFILNTTVADKKEDTPDGISRQDISFFRFILFASLHFMLLQASPSAAAVRFRPPGASFKVENRTGIQ